MTYAEKKGAGKSLNSTITAIRKHLDDDGWRPGPKDGGLRKFLDEKLKDLAEDSYRRGFKQAHKNSYRHFTDDGAVPEILLFEAKKRLAPGKKRQFSFKSKISGSK